MMRIGLSVFVCLVLLPAGALSVHPGNGPSSIANAADDNYAGFLLGESASSLFIAGNLTILNPFWAIGAAHTTFSDSARTVAYDSMEAGFGNNMLTSPRHKVTEVIVHPGYTGLGTTDLALFYFGDDPLYGYPSVSLYEGLVNVGDVISFSSYDPAAEGNQTPQFSPYRQTGSTIIEQFGFGNIPSTYAFSRFEEPGDSNFLSDGAGLNRGASGTGGLYNGSLAGIWALQSGTGYNSLNGMFLLHDYTSWIRSVQSQYPLPVDPDPPIPEPASAIIFGLGLVMVARNKMKKG